MRRSPISTKELHALFENAKREDMPEIWHSLRHGKWPEAFGEERPYWWEQAIPIVDKIPLIVGRKACFRYEQTHYGGMNDQMFDDWWDSPESAPYHINQPADAIEKVLTESGNNGRKKTKQNLATAFYALIGFAGGYLISTLICEFFDWIF